MNARTHFGWQGPACVSCAWPNRVVVRKNASQDVGADTGGCDSRILATLSALWLVCEHLAALIMALRLALGLLALAPHSTAVFKTDVTKKWLEDKSAQPGVITLASGLRYKVLTYGDGDDHPKADSSCSCHYEGTLKDGTKFDSSYGRGEPTDFAPNQVIPGWTEAMQLMVEGDV